ncbi:lipoprotein [Leptospira ryugenii]|uniref:Lipoprotein n=1 Tax=Leptospira ryugenii TaxID=1917863 RepID=A0A2P2DWZ1_9LEPT|nr:hypothetical protein [Leptospira ryugenii]GBF49155.1 lipoprotein [Leptospira ryugenii]
MNRIFGFCSLCLCLCFVNCFEYEETILFRKLNSGTVEVSYTVPLKKETQESLLKFLPTDRESIQKKILRKPSTSLVIRDFTFRELDKTEFIDTIFKRKGRVSYKIDFEDSAELEGILIGNFSSKLKARSLNVKREFPNLSELSKEGESVGEKKIIGETIRLLREGKLQFRVLFPKDSECISSRGLVGLGNVTYQMPLQETMENPEAKSWEYKIRFF